MRNLETALQGGLSACLELYVKVQVDEEYHQHGADEDRFTLNGAEVPHLYLAVVGTAHLDAKTSLFYFVDAYLVDVAFETEVGEVVLAGYRIVTTLCKSDREGRVFVVLEAEDGSPSARKAG